MLKRICQKKKGQNTAEYAILIALVVAAVIAMQTYVQRGLQAKMRDAVVDYMTNQLSNAGLGNSVQYEPYYLHTNFLVDRSSYEAIVQGNQRVGFEGNVSITRGKDGYQNIEYNTEVRDRTDL